MIPRIGILGGSFDPIHFDHLAMARAAQKLLNLEEIHFLVSRHPPHKSTQCMASPCHRFAMTALAVASERSWWASEVEVDSISGSSYTLDILAEFLQKTGISAENIIFLAGSDSLRDFHLWHAYRDLLSRYHWLFFTRPDAMPPLADIEIVRQGYDIDIVTPEKSKDACDALTHPARRLLVMGGTTCISSTTIRNMIESKQNCNTLIPEPVLEHIQKYNLYGAK